MNKKILYEIQSFFLKLTNRVVKVLYIWYNYSVKIGEINMKKILIINLAFVMIFTLSMCGCSKKETKVKSEKKEKVVQNKEKDAYRIP